MPKKFKWRKSKSAKEQPLADQNHNTTGEEKRQISGDIYVRGELEVETKFPPQLVEEYAAANKKETSHKHKTFIVEMITMFAVIIYAGLAAWQGCETREAISVARDANKLTEDSVRAHMIMIDFQFTRPVAVGQRTTVRFTLENIGRSQAVYGIVTATHRWRGMPAGDMPINDPDVSTPLEPSIPVEQHMFEEPTVTQDFIDGMPTMADLQKNPLNPTTPSTILAAPTQLTTYFIGKLLYDSIGGRRGKQFCFYMIRSDEASRKVNFPQITGDPNYIFSSCPKWNTSQEK